MSSLSDRKTVKRKWSAEKSAGPLVLLAEWLQKRLIQHAWPCSYARSILRYEPFEDGANSEVTVTAVRFQNAPDLGPLSEDFWDAFDCVLRILCDEKNLRAYRKGPKLYLDGVYHVNKYGVIKPGPMPPPF